MVELCYELLLGGIAVQYATLAPIRLFQQSANGGGSRLPQNSTSRYLVTDDCYSGALYHQTNDEVITIIPHFDLQIAPVIESALNIIL
jgi:hypothetical protein